MSIQIKYAYLKQQTWMYRRSYPKDVKAILGSSALKQSLKTSDPSEARKRVRALDAKFEEIVDKARGLSRGDATSATPTFDVVPVRFNGKAVFVGTELLGQLAKSYLNKRSNELAWGGFKSIRYSVGLLASKFGDRAIGSLTREDAKAFAELTQQLSNRIGKSERSRGLSLDQLVAFSRTEGGRITVRTHKRIFRQTNHFLDWCVYEGKLDENPFHKVLLDRKTRQAPYGVPTDAEVRTLLREQHSIIGDILRVCLLSGMRSGKAVGLLAEDLVDKGKNGTFIHIRPNSERGLKTQAAEWLVPLHPALKQVAAELPQQGPLFPKVTVAKVTKAFTRLREKHNFPTERLVFHSTRKWFITQCERSRVPEHFTASLVGHANARSENGLTYSIYSAEISDGQKREIVDAIQLPS